MTQQLKTPSFGRRVNKKVLGIILLGFIPAVLSFFGLFPVWLGIIAFIIAGVYAGVVSIRLLREFHCPRCHAPIPKHEPTENRENVPILYFCRPCDILWDTGLRTPSDL